jgi:hypothetical protein
MGEVLHTGNSDCDTPQQQLNTMAKVHFMWRLKRSFAMAKRHKTESQAR